VLLLLFHLVVIEAGDEFLQNLAVSILRMGWICIDLFFCLSGFLITNILIRTRHSPDYLKSFYARRALRVVPLYYALLFACFVIVPQMKLYGYGQHFWLDGEHSSVWFWLFAENVRIAATGNYAHELLSIAWTLSIEEQFYLLWPVVFIMMKPERLEKLCLFLVVAALGVRISMDFADVPAKIIHVLTPCRMDGIALGAYIAIKSKNPLWLKRAMAWLPILFWSFVLCLALGAVFVRLTEPSEKMTEFLYSRFFRTLGYSLSVGMSGVMVMGAAFGATGSPVQRFFGSRPLRFLGLYSYGIYLLHEPVIYLLRRHHIFSVGDYIDRPLLGLLLNLLVVPAVSLVAAILSWHLLEFPFVRLKRKFPYRTGTAKS
jgi:peptidoglycan/LPS O-acetylase OafA/YrhL